MNSEGTAPPAPPPSIREAVQALRDGEVSAVELTEVAIERHLGATDVYEAYRHFDVESARSDARAADARLAMGATPPLCGVPVSVKDLFGVADMPTYAGSPAALPEDPWSRDGWLVRRLREAGAIIVGKTHTVEFAYGGVGINPHWGTPRNPWDAEVPRIPGGSSCGAAVSLWEGSAFVGLGSDTGGSIRIPASANGLVGHKTTRGLWSTEGVVPLSGTFDTIGAITRTVEDSAWLYGAVDPRWGRSEPLLDALETAAISGLRVGMPECTIWEDCQADIKAVLEGTLEQLEAEGVRVDNVVATILDDAADLYLKGGIVKAECHAFLRRELPEWLDLLHPTVSRRLDGALDLDGDDYRHALAKQKRLAAFAHNLFSDVDILVLPTQLITPPPVAELESDLDRYNQVNLAMLRPTCPVNLLELCAITLPVGLDDSGMPVGLQLIAQGGEDEFLLGVALAVERAIGTAATRLGSPPLSV